MSRQRTLRLELLPALLIALLATLGAFMPWDRLLGDVIERRLPARPLSDQVRLVVAADEDVPYLEDWPWDRRVHAQLVECLTQAGARVICFDLLFAGAGRDPEGDALLAEGLAKGGRGVLGVAGQVDGTVGAQAAEREAWVARTLPAADAVRAPLAASMLFPPADLLRSAARLGFLNAAPDADGVLRRTWVLLEHEGRVVPSLPLAVWMLAQGRGDWRLTRGSDGDVVVQGAAGASLTLPVDERSRVRLDGTCEVRDGDVRSYGDVFQRFLDGGAEGLAEYRDRLVLVGNVMTASGDLVTTSRESRLHGLFAQAAVLSDLIDRRFVRELAPLLAGAGALALGVLALVSGAILGRWGRLLSGPALVAAVAVGAYVLRRHAALAVPLSGLLLAPAATWGGALLLTALEQARRRRALERQFVSFVPPVVLERVLAQGGDTAAVLERHEVGVLAGRLVGWQASALEPEAEADLLREVVAAATEAVQGAGGTLLRCTLDGVRAIFGQPTPVERPAHAALEAARRLRAAIHALNARWAPRLATPLGLPMGLHLGVATVGVVGPQGHREYTAFGAAVSHAEALAQRAQWPGVLGSERLQSLVTDVVPTELAGEVGGFGNAFELLLPDDA